MTRLLLSAVVLLATVRLASAQVELSYYLPDDVKYDPSVPTPSSVLGWEVGTWHVRHDQLVRYFEVLAESSPRMQLQEYARTHEGRRLLLATISSPENLAKVDQIREQHLACVQQGTAVVPTADRPVITWMGYGVHGNEASASNSSLLTAYHLCAAQGPEAEQLLQDSVILVDPCINPDGNARFAQWVNMHRGEQLVADGASREHGEAWPGGRTNHYWFDLNRDWLLLTHPESRGRIAQFHRWRPNMLTDYHEMGTGSSYFFQPGIPSRQNPHTPPANLHYTRKIAGYHAKALDAIGSQYYTEESFDDFYYGKGSTYPDVHGAIGILFEQASARGHLASNTYGELSFPFTIRNQFRTSLSSMKAAMELREKLLEYQMECTRTALEQAQRDPVKGYVFGGGKDPARSMAMIDVLCRHQVEVHELGREIGPFQPGSSWVVALNQVQYRLLKSLFDTSTRFMDNTFYDVSAWNFPYSFGNRFQPLDAAQMAGATLGARRTDAGVPAGVFEPVADATAYLFEWDSYWAPRGLQRLLAKGVKARVATRPLRAVCAEGERDFTVGTIVVPLGVQELARDELDALVRRLADEDGVDVYATGTGLTLDGIDLGSPNMRSVVEPRPLLLVGSGASSYEAGEAWHLCDHRYGMTVAVVDQDRFDRVDLDDYTHLVVVSGGGSGLDEAGVAAVGEWIRGGGVAVGIKGGATWLGEKFMEGRDGESDESGDESGEESAADEDEPSVPETDSLTYADYERLNARHRIAGTIFQAHVDITHPLAFGYRHVELAVFRNHSNVLPRAEDPFVNVVTYTDQPLLAGYASEEAVARVAGTAVVRAEKLGRGAVVRFVDDPNFRGVWYGTNKLFANALFFGAALKNTGPLKTPGEALGAEDSH